MKRLTVAAAAFAAATLTIVAQSHAEADHDYARSIVSGTATAKATSTGANDRKTASANDAKGGKKGTGKMAAAKAKRTKKGRTHIDLDVATTASITRVRPELKAVARKAVKGLDKVEDTGRIASAAGYTTIVAHYASDYGVPASLAHAVISVESNYRPNTRGSAGEIGLMQIKPATARMMGYSGSSSGLFDPETNIKYGMKYLALAHQLSGGQTCGTILRYNAGHGAKRMNPVSAAYCSKVQAILTR
jgi:soluble lytic murein transglycosylase-like protein